MAALTSSEGDGLLVALLGPQGRRDPYPLYAKLREVAPALRSEVGLVALSGYDDCLDALRNPRLGRGLAPGAGANLGPDIAQRRRERQALSMLFANPPDHTRLRRLVSREFTPGRVATLRPAIEAIVERLCDRMAEPTSWTRWPFRCPLP
jgi:cytochrome P450